MGRATVWRYENTEGHGPYSSHTCWTGKVAMSESHSDSSHKSWEEDELHWCVSSEYVAGCPSRRSLEQWFKGYADDLFRAGFRIVTYRVPAEQVEVGYSGTQVAFLKGSVRGVVHS